MLLSFLHDQSGLHLQLRQKFSYLERKGGSQDGGGARIHVTTISPKESSSSISTRARGTLARK